MPWATVAGNVYLPLKLAGLSRSGAAERIGESLEQSRPCGFRGRLSARIVRRHEDARLDRARAGDPAETCC